MPRRLSSACGIALAVAALAGFLPTRAFAAWGPAPPFTLGLLDGTTLSLADLKGAPAILLFWAPW